ncbi:hypothetical protein [Corynebacterium sp. Marseille-Q2823]|uniref:hypothetical protein n=1 Tax=Corynebacterium sp. Marseille-Q2823 TaxID=2736606 RepID=UPI00158C1C26|nr:hypothetical protein [Corynebacterium sp. Marseille-Q2823]
MKRKNLVAIASVVTLAVIPTNVAHSADLGANTTDLVQSTNEPQAFDEIFFADGPKAGELAQRLDNPAYSALVKETANSGIQSDTELEKEFLKTEIEKAQPGFIDRFNNEVSTGNPYRVEAVLEEGSELIVEVVNPEEAPGDATVSPQCALAVVWTLGMAVNIALAVNVETAVLVHHKAWLAESNALMGPDEASLNKQKNVRAITDTYAQ